MSTEQGRAVFASTGAQQLRLIDVKNKCLELICQMLDKEKDEDIVFTLLIAAGTLIHQEYMTKQRAIQLGLIPKLRIHCTSTTTKISQTASFIRKVLENL